MSHMLFSQYFEVSANLAVVVLEDGADWLEAADRGYHIGVLLVPCGQDACIFACLIQTASDLIKLLSRDLGWKGSKSILLTHQHLTSKAIIHEVT